VSHVTSLYGLHTVGNSGVRAFLDLLQVFISDRYRWAERHTQGLRLQQLFSLVLLSTNIYDQWKPHRPFLIMCAAALLAECNPS